MKKQGRKPVLIACDLYRPAAIEQLVTLGKQLDVPVHAPPADEKNVNRVAIAGSEWARENHADVEIYDTAGRQELDEPLIEEVKALRM